MIPPTMSATGVDGRAPDVVRLGEMNIGDRAGGDEGGDEATSGSLAAPEEHGRDDDEDRDEHGLQ